MKKLFRSVFFVVIVSLIVACSSASKKESPKKIRQIPKTVEKNRTQEGDYNLEYTFFKKRALPLPDSFKGEAQEYLVARNDTLKKYGYDFFKGYNEEQALKFYKDTDVRGYGDNSLFWRWKISLDRKDFFTAIKNNLLLTYSSRPKDVLTLKNGVWSAEPITSAKIGSVQNVEIAGRGRSGIITYVLVTTNKNKFLVAKELNIRKLFALNKKIAQSKDDIHLYGARGGEKYKDTPIRTNLPLFPSGYFALEYVGNSVNIYGGGYGHGVGMSQYSASDLANNHNYDYKKILKRSYPNTHLKNMYSLSGIGKTINVGITNSARTMDHSKVILSSGGKMRITGAGFKIDVPKKQKIVIENKGKKLWISVGGKHRVKTVNPVDITAYGYYINLEGVKRAHTSSPRYRGDMRIKPSPTSSKGIRVINIVQIEDYLKQVVPSEMPESFGVEALKAQAVAARTYALSDYLKNKYAKDGFHVKDTVESQVYNNAKENQSVEIAIEKTKGMVLLNEGKPIDAKYFSTSSGFTEASNYVW